MDGSARGAIAFRQLAEALTLAAVPQDAGSIEIERLPSDMPAFQPGPAHTGTHSLDDEIALQLSNGPDDDHDRPAQWAAGIDCCVAALEKDGYISNDLFTFKVDGELLHSHPDVRSYWTALTEGVENGSTDTLRQCVVCGEMRAAVDKHDSLQIPGGVTSGVGLVTFNSAAFEKYGLERNENAPLCRLCMTAYVEALRRCLSERYPRPDDPEAAFPERAPHR